MVEPPKILLEQKQGENELQTSDGRREEDLQKKSKKVSFEGGAIERKRIRKKSPKRDEKVEQALATKVGGAIERKRIRKKSPKRDEKVDQALATKVGGGIKRFHSALHKHLHENLSGKGGKLDPPHVRNHMYQIMSNYHPNILSTYMTGRVHREPKFTNDHHIPSRRGTDTRADVIYSGGSMKPLSHCEDGYLVYHDSDHHPFAEIV